MAETWADPKSVEDEDEFFDMANLPPDFTGLPMVVWVSERGRSRHDVRVKVSLIRGPRARPDRMTSVSVRPNIEVVAGPPLSADDLVLVRRWIELNRDTILDYWSGRIYTNELIARLQPISP